jgi:hypothetical protein
MFTSATRTILNNIRKENIQIPKSKLIHGNALMQLRRDIRQSLSSSSSFSSSSLTPVEEKINCSMYSSIPKPIRDEIERHCTHVEQVQFTLPNSTTQVRICIYSPKKNKKRTSTIVALMTSWLRIISQYANNKTCSKKQLTIFLYQTTLCKMLPPHGKNSLLDEINVNTAFTQLCSEVSELVIFRQEEWFKVFIHETLHNFGIDFSGMNSDAASKNVFFVPQCKLSLFESYTEFWARLINVCYCNVLHYSNKNDTFQTMVYIEQQFAIFQAQKVLTHAGLEYTDLLEKRATQYKENTNALCYYILVAILLYDVTDTLEWCATNNYRGNNLLQFRNTKTNINAFVSYLRNQSHSFYLTTKEEKERKERNTDFAHSAKQPSATWMNQTLRMSTFELSLL